MNEFWPVATDGPFLASASPKPNKYVHTYYMEDGTVVSHITAVPETTLMQKCYLATVSVPRQDNSAPFVEIIKSRHDSAALILTGNVLVQETENLPSVFKVSIMDTGGDNRVIEAVRWFDTFDELSVANNLSEREYDSATHVKIEEFGPGGNFVRGKMLLQPNNQTSSYALLVENIYGAVHNKLVSKWYDNFNDCPFTEEESNSAALVEMIEYDGHGVCMRKKILRDHTERQV